MADGSPGALKEAKAVAEDAVVRRTRASGADAVEIAALHNNLGSICHALDDVAGAIGHLEQSPAPARKPSP